MSSVGNSNPWAPYDNYKDCSLGICSIYCPQFCYLIFPPPPPDDDSGTPFSPLIIAIIGVLASAFLLVSYYTIVTRYCQRRNPNGSVEAEEIHGELDHDQWHAPSSGLDETLIKNITVCKYVKGDGLIEGTDCAVCLSEFQENESLRLLPKCSHAFHLPCIDTWLKSHSNCPLCRANVVILPPSPRNPSVNMSSYEVHRPNDLVLVVDDSEIVCSNEHVVLNVDEAPKSPVRGNGNRRDSEILGAGNDGEGVNSYRRSISLGAFSSQPLLLISDILKFEEGDEDLQCGIGSSKENGNGEMKSSGNRSWDMGLMRSPVAMKRSVSTGRFIFRVDDDKGKNSVLPN